MCFVCILFFWQILNYFYYYLHWSYDEIGSKMGLRCRIVLFARSEKKRRSFQSQKKFAQFKLQQYPSASTNEPCIERPIAKNEAIQSKLWLSWFFYRKFFDIFKRCSSVVDFFSCIFHSCSHGFFSGHSMNLLSLVRWQKID